MKSIPLKQQRAATAISEASAAAHHFSTQEIAHLAYINWERDGRPQGQDMQYWFEAECQLRATWHLLAAADAASQAANAFEQNCMHRVATAFSTRSQLR